jgi:hypothetical protein
MTDATSGIAVDHGRRDQALLLVLVLALSLALCLRFALSPHLLNEFVSYTEDGGFILEKFHPGTYAILLVLLLTALVRPIRLDQREVVLFRVLFRFGVGSALIGVVMLALGRSGAAGFMIDTYLCAAAAGMAMLALGAAGRRAVYSAVLCLFIAGALIGILEALLEVRINPFKGGEEVFRPTGLADHPLSFGLLCATAMGCVAVTRWNLSLRVAAICVLFVALGVSGARFATILGAGALLLMLMYVPWPGISRRAERQGRLVVLVLAVVGGVALTGLLLAGGMLSRFSEGLIDENFFARITVYQVFGMTGWRDILFGTDTTVILDLVNDRLGLPFIEQSPVIFVYEFGLPLALVFTVMMVRLFSVLLTGATLPVRLATAVFFLAALSNNTLSSKTSLLAVIVVLILGAEAASRQPLARNDRRSPVLDQHLDR